jgi:hypothetical protein
MSAGGLAREEVVTGIRSSYKLSKTANIAQEMPGPTTWAFEIASACDYPLLLALRPTGSGLKGVLLQGYHHGRQQKQAGTWGFSQDDYLGFCLTGDRFCL